MGSRKHRYRSPSVDSKDERKSRQSYRRRSESIDEDRSRHYRSKHKRERTHSPSPSSSHRQKSYREISSYSSRHRNSTNQNSRHAIEKVSQSKELFSSSKAIVSHQTGSHIRQINLDRDNDKPKKEKPNFAPTGLLAAESNSVIQADGSAIVLKYHEPTEARKSTTDEWRMYVFKGSDILETIELNRKSCWLVGRDQLVVDVIAEHPSVSKQHAVIQFRYVQKSDEFGIQSGRVKPYVIDLDSANGTLLNKDEIPKSRYLELRDKDMLQFAHSSREYVLMLTPKI
ncbi:Smad nuclear-interacting protein 1 [Erysiphe neolycopersici]|uniref:Smad nuclear-interacting protein 1 n=1 Tax=Erysiphe neolycopersici TaxID=212602 RepID=A0A420HSG9_9PEZI|nr:Smad nuclear-interacting protein 1 [Erysiphe neolycopersici]